jgi:hypothetical protein
MRCLLAISAFIALVSANTEKIIFHTTESPLSENNPSTITHIDAWAERNEWPVLRAPFTTLEDTIRPQSSLDEGPNPINPENPHYEYQSEIPFQRWYRIRGLIEGGGYETRISYPATVKSLRWFCAVHCSILIPYLVSYRFSSRIIESHTTV